MFTPRPGPQLADALDDSPSSPRDAVEGVGAVSTTRGGSVWIADLDTTFTWPLDRALRGAGFDTHLQPVAIDAPAATAKHAPEALILGATVDECASFDIMRSVLAQPRFAGVPTLLVLPTGAPAQAGARALDLGADDVIRKPCEVLELVARVRKLLRARVRRSELEMDTARLIAENKRLERMAVRDPLTGIYNRRYFDQRLAEEIERSSRYGQPLSLVLADIDLFKAINDRHGHSIGDAVLRGVAATLERTVRRVDMVARFGGEEFIAIAPATSTLGGRTLAERMRVALANAPMLATTGSGLHATLRVTASFGVTTMGELTPRDTTSATQLLERADGALYRAKAAGRNRVCVHGE